MLEPPVAKDQHLLFTREQALLADWSKGRLDRALARRELTALAAGVYVATERLLELGRRDRHLLSARAVILADGDHWRLARRTAAVLHGLPLLGTAPTEAQLSRTRSGRSQSTSRHRRVHTLDDVDTEMLDGLPCTSVARTVFDIARTESLRSGVVVADAALRAGVPREAILDVLDRHRGWPGSRRARQVVLFADGRAESPLESLGRVTCLEEGLPLFEPQVEVRVHGELIGRVDGLWREQLVVFEGDGASKFDGEGVLPALLSRQQRLREGGLPVVRAFWPDVTRRRKQWARGVRWELADNPGRLRPGVELRSTAVRVTPLDRSDHYRWPPLPYGTPRGEAFGEPPLRGVA